MKTIKLKSNGKKLETALRLDQWVKNNSDKLYANEALRNMMFQKIRSSKNIDELLAFKHKHHRKDLFEKKL